MNLKPLSPLTRWLLLFLKLNLGILLIAIGADVYSLSEYSRLDPMFDVEEHFLTSDVLNLIVGLIQLCFFIFLGVTFLRWIYRANQNLRAQSDRSMTFTPGWAVGWYFIPVANLFKPYQAMKEIWAAAHREPIHGNALLRCWWSLWLISSVCGQVALRVGLRARDVESYRNSAITDLVSDIVDIPLTFAAILLVLRIGKAYETNYAAAPSEVPPPLPSAIGG